MTVQDRVMCLLTDAFGGDIRLAPPIWVQIIQDEEIMKDAVDTKFHSSPSQYGSTTILNVILRKDVK